MFSFLSNLFNKVVFDEYVIARIEDFNKIKWCGNLEKESDIKCKYDIIRCNKKDALRYLDYKSNSRGVICLENVFNAGSNNMSWYLSTHNTKLFNSEWNSVSEKSASFVDFNKLKKNESEFCLYAKKEIDIKLSWLAYMYVQNIYFGRIYPDIPSFPLDVLDIYHKGHIIVGWKGKTIFQEGHLLIL